MSNLQGLLPFGFTITSQILITFSLSVSIFVGIVVLGFMHNKFNFLKLFIPSGVNIFALKVFLVLIEVLSFLIRPLSLGIRLFANMLAGHTLLHILCAFVNFIFFYGLILIVLIPILISSMVMLLEICICFIQAYVFTMLVTIYIRDVYNISH